jgi:hypothetical protein
VTVTFGRHIHMRASKPKHAVYVDESLDPNDVAYAGYCVCGWNGPWISARECDNGVLEAFRRAGFHGSAHMTDTANTAPAPARESA